MLAATDARQPLRVADEVDSPRLDQPAPAAAQHPRTTLRFDADPTRPATITTEVKAGREHARRNHLERELDRIQLALATEQTGFGQQLTWLLLSQGLLLNGFVLLLVFGWSSPLPGRRLLLAAVALTAVAIAVIVALALRGAGDALRTLAKARADLERRLEVDHGRRPLFARPSQSGGFGPMAARLLPALLVAGWLALALYTLGLPPGAAPVQEARATPTVPEARAPARAAPAPAQPAPASEQQPAKRAPLRWHP